MPPPQFVASSEAAINPKRIRRCVRRVRRTGIVMSTIPGTMPSEAASIHWRAGKSAAVVVVALMVRVEVPAGPALPGVIEAGENEHFKLGGRFAHESWKVCPIAFCKAVNEILKVAD